MAGRCSPAFPPSRERWRPSFRKSKARPVRVAGSGRTDAGVHALAQVAAFTMENPIPLSNLQRAVNRLLPPAIRVLSVEQVQPGFSSAFRRQSQDLRVPHLPGRGLRPLPVALRASLPVSAG